MFGAIRGVIDRRLLVNYRADTEALDRVLPEPFRAKEIGTTGKGLGGICLIRLRDVRPKFMPASVGFGSENAAHRIAVEWREDGELRNGVYIPRRDTSSRLNSLAGGRLFPGVHGHADFTVEEGDGSYSVDMRSREDDEHVHVEARETEEFPSESVFDSLDEVSRFFRDGSVGYSPVSSDTYEGLELHTYRWSMSPLQVGEVYSSYFEGDDASVDEADFDCALLMRDIGHEWRAKEPICRTAEP